MYEDIMLRRGGMAVKPCPMVTRGRRGAALPRIAHYWWIRRAAFTREALGKMPQACAAGNACAGWRLSALTETGRLAVAGG